MESLLKQVPLTQENGDCTARRSFLRWRSHTLRGTVPIFTDLDRVLDEIRAGADNALYGAGPDVSEELFAKHVVSLVEGAGLPVLQTMHYRWFLRELTRLWRTRTGRDLAFHLGLCIRKWVGLGLEPKTLQFLVCEAHQRLKGKFEGQSGNDECTTSVRNPNLPESVESVDNPPESADVQARISHPPITPITEDFSSSVRNPDLRESVESVDNPPGPSSADDSSSATGILESSNPGILSDESSTPRILPVDFSLPGIMAGPRPPADPATGSSLVPSPSPLTPDIETAKDAKIAKAGPDSDTGPLDSSNPGVL